MTSGDERAEKSQYKGKYFRLKIVITVVFWFYDKRVVNKVFFFFKLFVNKDFQFLLQRNSSVYKTLIS